LPGEWASLYVIGVDGIPLGGAASPDSFRGNTLLRSTGKAKWTVKATVARELIRNSAVYAFGFPRKAAPIEADGGEVFFESQFGRWKIRAKFQVKAMYCRGQLAL
jgi:hypothetical protein